MDIYNLKSESEIQELLKTPVENLKYEFNNKSFSNTPKILKNAGIKTLSDVLNKTPWQLMNEHKIRETTVRAIVNAVKRTGIEYGNDFLQLQQIKADEKYKRLFEKVIDDGVVDPVELSQLKSLQEELGLSDDRVKEITKNYYTQSPDKNNLKKDTNDLKHPERPEKEIVSDFIEKIKDNLPELDKKTVEVVLLASKKALASFSSIEKEVIGKFLLENGAKDKKSLNNLIKKQLEPPEYKPEYKISRKRSISWGHSR